MTTLSILSILKIFNWSIDIKVSGTILAPPTPSDKLNTDKLARL